jgi:hypothetical protein
MLEVDFIHFEDGSKAILNSLFYVINKADKVNDS